MENSQNQALPVDTEMSNQTSQNTISRRVATNENDCNISLKLTPVPLNGLNYLSWARAVSYALNIKGMLGYINGKLPSPAPTSADFEVWQANDQLVSTWITNSLTPKVYELFSFSNSSKDLWDSIKDLYGQQNNLYRVFELKKKLAEAKQGDKSITEYLGYLKNMWDELTMYRPPTTDLITVQRQAEQDKIFQLLSGLKPEYESVQSQFLMSNDLPSIASICSKLQQEETRRKLSTTHKEKEQPEEESSAFYSDSDAALSYLFLANNLRYVVSKVTASNLRFLLGGDWVERHEAKVRQYVANYERIGWEQVLQALTNGPKPGDERAPLVDNVAEKFRRFNIAFEEAYKKQSTWVITDPKLRDEIKVSLARKIVPVYREFYECFRGLVITSVARERGMGPAEGIVRYAPDDLENYLSDLFFGGEAVGSVSSSSDPSVPSSSGSSRGRRST